MALTKNLATIDDDINQMFSRIIKPAFRYGMENDIILGAMKVNGAEQGLTVISDNQNYEFGTKRIHKGKVFYYSKSGGACWTGRGNKGMVAISDGIDFTLLGATSPVGSKQITFAAATHPEFAVDDLVGGLVLISDQDSGDTQDKKVQQRICVGNTASLEDAACTITLDEPLDRQVTAATYAFVMPSQFSNVAFNDEGSGGISVVGVPAAYVNAANKYFWLQTWGPCWLANQNAVGRTAFKRQFVFRHDGSIDLLSEGGTSPVLDQIGGYIIDNNAAVNGATFVMLTLNP